ncbi:MAG: M23 family metallopeptidase [Myxococcota bacterium]
MMGFSRLAALPVLLTGCAALLDRTPPAASLDEAPAHPVQAASFVLTASDAETGVGEVTVAVDDAEPTPLVASEGVVRWTAEGLADGVHRFRFTVADGATFPNRTVVEAERTLDTTPPTLTWLPGSGVAHQGRTWAAWVGADEPLAEATLTVSARDDDGDVGERVTPMYAVGDAWRALRGIELREELGPRPVVVQGTDLAGNVGRLETTVDVQQTEFEEGGYIKLSKKQVAARRDEEGIAKMRADRNAAYAVVIPEQLWQGTFTRPVPEARQTSPFGKYRSYSDGRKSYHTGLDLSDDRGTPVLAAAGGEVLVAHEMAIFGNVVILGHGQGVTTSYNHLDRIDVKEGERVTAGQPLGLLGSTGQSTGPHLHWGMEVAEVAVDPGEWLEDGFGAPAAEP